MKNKMNRFNNYSVNIALIYLLGQKNKIDFFKFWLKDFVYL